MPNYKNGKIYKIGYGNDIYIGSTTAPLSQRMAQHRYTYKNKLKDITVHSIFDKHGLDKCYIELIEVYPCKNKKELEKRETKYINHFKTVNIDKK
jgi:hypothetical protein